MPVALGGLGRGVFSIRTNHSIEERGGTIRVSLVDVDLKYREKTWRGVPIPNLALMKVSAYYKSLGYETGLFLKDEDIRWISCVFEKNKQFAYAESYRFVSESHIGGSGIDLHSNLPDHIEKFKPDYDLYPSDYSQGFTTRGCPRMCGYCIVHEKEGRFRRAQHVMEFHDERFDTVMLMDNNILFDVDWFFCNTDWIIQKHLKVREHGMDIRLLTDEICEQLKQIRFVDQQMHFAWDNINDEFAVMAGIDMLKDHGFNLKRNISFYVMSGYNTTIEQDIYRCNRLKELGVMAYVMKYHDNDPTLNHLARWANKRQLYRTTSFEEYLKKKVSHANP